MQLPPDIPVYTNDVISATLGRRLPHVRERRPAIAFASARCWHADMRSLLATAGLFLLLACHSPRVIAPSPSVAPLLELVDIDGQPRSLARERGHPLLLHFGASW